MDETIVFFGSGPLAAASLAFLNRTFNVEAVVTKPTTQAEMTASAPGKPLYTAANKQELTELIGTKPFQSRLAILVDFGIIVEKAVISYFPLGIINSHFSLLPHWRGADPISFAILEGDTKTGVSLMLIDEGLDTGKLITQKVLHIKPKATTPSLTDELVELSNNLLKEFVPRYVAGEIKPHNQPHPDRVTHSHKLEKQDGVIDWNKPAEQIEREVRGYLGWPGSRTTLAGRDVIITEAHSTPTVSPEDRPGDLTIVPEAHEFGIATSRGIVWIDRLKPVGKNEMSAAEFMRGYLNK